MILRHARFLKGFRLLWEPCRPRCVILKPISTSWKTFRYVIEQQRRYFVQTHTQPAIEAPAQRSEIYDESGSNTAPVFSRSEHSNLNHRNPLSRGNQLTSDTSELHRSASSGSRLIVGTQASLRESVHCSSTPEVQRSANASTRAVSRQRRLQAPRDPLVRRVKVPHFTRFASLVSRRQSRRRKKASNHVARFSRHLWRWNREFAQLCQRKAIDIVCPILESPLGSRLLKDNKDQAPQLWKQLSATLGSSRLRRQSVWHKVMLWVLQHDHDRALKLLNTAVRDPISQPGSTRYAVEDSIQYLVSVYLEEKVISKEKANNLHQLFGNAARATKTRNTYMPSRFPQKTIHLLIRNSTKIQAQSLYRTIVECQLNIHPLTLTHFINVFSRYGRPDLAMDALRRIAGSGGYITSDIVQYSCIALLRTRFDKVDWYRIQSHLVTEMLELGVRPGIPMLNAMIFNAVEAGDYQTAQAMFDTARTHGVRRDTITYSILLKIALRNSDVNLVEKIMKMAEEDGALPRNNQLVFCLVATMLQIAQCEVIGSEVLASRYEIMLQIYARYCDIRPLQELGIALDVSRETEVTKLVSKPSPRLLSVMILGYIRLFGRSHEVKRLYYRYQSLIAQDHHLVAFTAETDHLVNAFLLCLGQYKTTFTMLPIIIRDMLERPLSTTVKFAKPTVQTWSIVLRSYFFNNQRAAAEKILQMMRARAVRPNQVTMNTIISGYAKMQDAFAAVDTMQQMEAAGLRVDSYTLKGLTRIVNRDELLNALRRVQQNLQEPKKLDE